MRIVLPLIKSIFIYLSVLIFAFLEIIFYFVLFTTIPTSMELISKVQEISILKHPNNSKKIQLSTSITPNTGSSEFDWLGVQELRSFKGDRNKIREYYNSIGVLPNSKAGDGDGKIYIVFINVVEKITNNNAPIDEDYEEWTFSALKTEYPNVTDFDRKSNFYILESVEIFSYRF